MQGSLTTPVLSVICVIRPKLYQYLEAGVNKRTPNANTGVWVFPACFPLDGLEVPLSPAEGPRLM